MTPHLSCHVVRIAYGINASGTHLILPPCVSLGRQGINRFSSPKNLRLMNSIRESCRSIEELDLGDNKLTDLIEVYKILQCTPNLRFLNLSENDLSRTSPVAMAAASSFNSNNNNNNCPATATSSGGQHFSQSSSVLTGQSPSALLMSHHNQQLHCSSSLSGQISPNQRSCLAPINQNHQHHRAFSAMTNRRHSTLGQSTSSGSSSGATTSASGVSNRSQASAGSRQVQARSRTAVVEARRLAAANALAQSKKTSSSVASRLANTAAAAAAASGVSSRTCRTNDATESTSSSSSPPAPLGTSATKGTLANSGHKPTRAGAASQRHQMIGPTSTMHLARSLSSLSAKDLRAANSSASRYISSAHRSSIRNIESGHRVALGNNRRSSIESMRTPSAPTELKLDANLGSRDVRASRRQLESSQGESGGANLNKITTSTSHQKLYAEPIVETEDVDMSAEQQVSPNGNCSSGSTTSGNAHTSSSLSSTTVSQATTAASRGGSNSSSSNHTGSITTTATNTTLRSVCNTNNGLLATIGSGGGTGQTNFRRTFESIRALALNNTGCQWKVVCSILSRMPNLEELHISLNNYERIDLEPNEFKHFSLKRLYLCNNPKLTNWQELDKLLVAFPSLEALSIADCNISQIPDNLDRAREWRKLCGLNINGWPIKEWPVVERLNQLPSLIDLRCRNLDVLNSIDEPRHHLIARLPKLQRLNGSEIEEREHAEKAFLRFFMLNSHLERPPRFHELMQIYGEVPQHVDVDVDLSPPSQARVRVIYLNRNYYCKENEDDVLMSEDFLLKLMDNVDANNGVVQQQDSTGISVSSAGAGSGGGGNNSLQENMDIAEGPSSTDANSSTCAGGPVRLFKDAGQEVVALEVDLRQSVRKFKSTIASLFGLSSQNLILYYIDHEMVGLMGPELIKHNQKKLWNYNVQDGDQFIVEDR